MGHPRANLGELGVEPLPLARRHPEASRPSQGPDQGADAAALVPSQGADQGADEDIFGLAEPVPNIGKDTKGKADEQADPIMKNYVRKHLKTAIGELAAYYLYDVVDGKINSEIRRLVKVKGMKIHNWCEFEGVSTWVNQLGSRRLHKIETEDDPPPASEIAAPDSDPEQEDDMRRIQRQRDEVWKKAVEVRKTYVTFNAPPT